jgi:hypothetical protein
MINNYNQLPIGKFLELQAIDYTQSEIDIQVEIISILADLTIDEVVTLPLTKYQELAKQTKFLTTAPEPSKKLPKKLRIGEKDFVVIDDVRKMTAGQYIDYQTYLTYKEEKYLPHILTCFIIPKGEKYGDTDVIELIDLFTEKLNIITALSISAFFLNKWESLTKTTLIYLEWKIKRVMKKEKNPQVKMKLEKAMKEIITFRNLIKGGGGLTGQLP